MTDYPADGGLIYLLFDHGEDGPEHLIADVDPARFRRRALEWLEPGYLAARWLADHPRYTRESIVGRLDDAIAAGRPGDYPLVDGWGGAVVQVVAYPTGDGRGEAVQSTR